MVLKINELSKVLKGAFPYCFDKVVRELFCPLKLVEPCSCVGTLKNITLRRHYRLVLILVQG